METPVFSEIVTLKPFPAVITGAQIRELRARPRDPQTLDFIAAYLAFDARSAHAIGEVLTSLSRPSRGAGFWLNGVYGAGKSHFLGLLALLCEGAGHEEFLQNYPAFRGLLAQFEKRFVVSIALDDWGAARFGLEEIFWREWDNEWRRQGLEIPEIARDGSRAESFAALEESLRAHGFSGLVVLFDELSLFLGGREHRALQEDAAFLQFLGQHATRAPLWVFGALQKTIEDIGPLEPYSLGQIRDRYTTLPLSLAHLPLLIERRLVEVQDAARLESWCRASFEELEKALPRLDFGPQEWRALFPFHPSTVALLDAVTGRFFSRTRSAALFCAKALENLENRRIGPDAIWDYFAPEIGAHPDLRPLAEVWETWQSSADTLAPAHAETLRRAMKFLLVCKVAGQIPTVIQIANALEISVGLEGDGNYEFTRQLLEKLRRGAPFLAVERGENTLHDRYTVDLGKRVADLARRATQGAGEGLRPGDARLASYAIQAARREPFPLGEIGQNRSFSFFWGHSARQIAVSVWDGATPASLANRALATREFGARDEAFLLLLPPFSLGDFDGYGLARLLPDKAAQSAFWLWKPRPPARDEWELCREATAAHLAAQDPALLDNRRGRSILEYLEREAPARENALGKIVARLFLEGEIALLSGASLEAGELRRAENFAGLLESLGEFALPQLFPKWPLVAPRARLLTPSNADALCLEILRQNGEEGVFSPSLERLARHLAEPLGVAKMRGARFHFAPGNEELTREIKGVLGEGMALGHLEATFAKNEWGLPPETLALAVCALLRSGDLTAFDARGQELSPAQIGLPLRRSVHLLRPGRLPDGATWTKLALLARELWNGKVGAPSFSEASRIALELDSWREETARLLEIARARAAQLRRTLRQENASWREWEGASETLAACLNALPNGAGAGEKLARAASFDLEKLRDALAKFRRFSGALETRAPLLLAGHGVLWAPDLSCPPDLGDERARLLERFGSGETVLFDDELAERIGQWSAEYGEKYRAWHASQNEAARGYSLRRLAASNELRALERLGLLQNRAPEDAAVLRGEIEDELEKLCSRDGQLERGRATCSSCGLKLGERLRLREAREFQNRAEAALQIFASWLRDETVRAVLARRESPILGWDGASETLFSFLTPATLRDLDEAFAPRRRVLRSLQTLQNALESCRTRADFERAFALWLDGGEALSSEDEVVFESSP